MNRVMAGLDAQSLRGRERVWWSTFRTGWPVDRWGKWREPEYTVRLCYDIALDPCVLASCLSVTGEFLSVECVVCGCRVLDPSDIEGR